MADSKSDDENWIKKNWVILVAFLVMACVIGFYFFQFSPYDLSKDLCINTTGDEADCLSKDAARWGTFGDFFGGTLNPILSFLALIIVLKTYLSQQEELQETRKILKEQSETQKRQQFDNTFFELLKVHNEVLSKIPEDTTFAAYENYLWILYQLLKFIAINSSNGITEDFEEIDIERGDVKPLEKMYSNIVRACLTNNVERVFNYYHERDDKANYKKYKLLVERYAFF